MHGLVNSAGITRPAMADKMTLEQWRQVLDVHLTGSFLFLQAVGREMIARAKAGDARPGSIVNIRSEEHTSELQSLMRISYAVFCLKKKNNNRDKKRTKPTIRWSPTE